MNLSIKQIQTIIRSLEIANSAVSLRYNENISLCSTPACRGEKRSCYIEENADIVQLQEEFMRLREDLRILLKIEKSKILEQ